MRGAGTDAAVWFELSDDAGGSSGLVRAPAVADAFARAARDVFRLELPRLGRLARLAVWLEGGGGGNDGGGTRWFLRHAEVQRGWDSSAVQPVSARLAQADAVASFGRARHRCSHALHTCVLQACCCGPWKWRSWPDGITTTILDKLACSPRAHARGSRPPPRPWSSPATDGCSRRRRAPPVRPVPWAPACATGWRSGRPTAGAPAQTPPSASRCSASGPASGRLRRRGRRRH